MRVKRINDDYEILLRCQFCDKEFQHGHHRYEGKYLPHYGLLLCSGCYKGNWDGIGPFYEDKFTNHLAERGIELPERNSKGWYPLDYDVFSARLS